MSTTYAVRISILTRCIEKPSSKSHTIASKSRRLHTGIAYIKCCNISGSRTKVSQCCRNDMTDPRDTLKESFQVTSTKDNGSDSLAGSGTSPNEIWIDHGRADRTFDNVGLQKHYEPIDAYEGKHRYDPKATWTVEEEKKLVRKVGFRLLLLYSPVFVYANPCFVPQYDPDLWLRSILIDVRSTGASAAGPA